MGVGAASNPGGGCATRETCGEKAVNQTVKLGQQLGGEVETVAKGICCEASPRPNPPPFALSSRQVRTASVSRTLNEQWVET